MKLDKKYILIYSDGTIWKNNNESIAIAKLDSDTNIIGAYVKQHGGSYKYVSDGDGVSYKN